ncbi:MAG: class I SAM-dependent methyltransferase [Bacteroidota bacterium]
MNTKLLAPTVQEFIRTYSEPTAVLAFKGSPFEDITVQELITQIEGFRKTKNKLPLWHQTPGIYYPARLNIEQTSSETTAAYKTTLVQGNSLADITGGYGVDAYYFSKRFESVHHFEKVEALSDIARHNFSILDANKVQCHSDDGVAAVSSQSYDVIYADPARRHDAKGKVFLLADCEPDLVTHASSLLRSCKTMLVKTSPMLDISLGWQELPNSRAVHVVAVDNEVKELLWLLEDRSSKERTITAVNIRGEQREEFTFVPESPEATAYSQPLTYLFEPNAAILKAGGYRYLSAALGVPKLHKHSHLFTSESLAAFPGRVFRINKILPYRKPIMQRELKGIKANITTRNFPVRVEDLRKKWRISDGGEVYLFFTTIGESEKVVLHCERIAS